MFKPISKVKATGIAITCVGMTILLLIAHMAVCIGPFVLGACVYGCIAWYKYTRDTHIANETRYIASTQQQVLPPMKTNPGSSRLFVPPPLPRQ